MRRYVFEIKGRVEVIAESREEAIELAEERVCEGNFMFDSLRLLEEEPLPKCVGYDKCKMYERFLARLGVKPGEKPPEGERYKCPWNLNSYCMLHR